MFYLIEGVVVFILVGYILKLFLYDVMEMEKKLFFRVEYN